MYVFNRYICITIIFIFIFLLNVFHLMSTMLEPIFVIVKDGESSTCYNSSDKFLPKIDDNVTSDKRIFFHEVSCRGSLNYQQACAIESAAKWHPNWRTEVIFLGPVQNNFEDQDFFRILNKSNVFFSSTNLVEHFRNTPLETYPDLTKLTERVPDILRYITLYKYGGVYLDLNVIVVKPFDRLPKNWVAKRSFLEIGAGAIGLSNDSLGRTVANVAMDMLSDVHILLESSSDDILQGILERVCSTQDIAFMTAGTCNGLSVQDKTAFYPIPVELAEDYKLMTPYLTLAETYTAFAHHTWVEKDPKQKITAGTRYGKLAQIFCPLVFDFYKDR